MIYSPRLGFHGNNVFAMISSLTASSSTAPFEFGDDRLFAGLVMCTSKVSGWEALTH